MVLNAQQRFAMHVGLKQALGDEVADLLVEQLSGGDISRLDIRLDQVDQRLDGVEQRLDVVEQRLDRVEQRLDRVEQRLDRVEQRLSAVEVQLKTMDTRLVNVEVRLDNLEKKVDTHFRWMLGLWGTTMLTIIVTSVQLNLAIASIGR
jgi:chromosome segregation ATPase